MTSGAENKNAYRATLASYWMEKAWETCCRSIFYGAYQRATAISTDFRLNRNGE
jgi:hypothetical protein